MKKLDVALIGVGALGIFLLVRHDLKQKEEAERQKIRGLGNALAEAERLRLEALEAERRRGLPPPTPGSTTPSQPAAPRLVQIMGPLVTVPGRRYLVNIETNGSVNAAASVSKIGDFARKEGFSDVNVSEVKPQGWPSSAGGDYFLEGTYAGSAPKTWERKTSVFLGSVVVLDAWELLRSVA